jgi:ERCC4-type nuclease
MIRQAERSVHQPVIATDDASSARSASSDFVVSPFVILRDSREQSPWFFQNIPAGAKYGNKPWLVRSEWQYLGDHQGDYTIHGAEINPTENGGMQWRVSIERKSMNDLFGTILARRENFEKELENLNRAEFGAVIVEGDWESIKSHVMPHWDKDEVPERERVRRRRTVVQSISAWDNRYRVKWWFLPGKREAEMWCFDKLYRFWKERMANG